MALEHLRRQLLVELGASIFLLELGDLMLTEHRLLFRDPILLCQGLELLVCLGVVFLDLLEIGFQLSVLSFAGTNLREIDFHLVVAKRLFDEALGGVVARGGCLGRRSVPGRAGGSATGISCSRSQCAQAANGRYDARGLKCFKHGFSHMFLSSSLTSPRNLTLWA